MGNSDHDTTYTYIQTSLDWLFRKPKPTLEATQGQILSKSPTVATPGR
jgi:hypothetical protein